MQTQITLDNSDSNSSINWSYVAENTIAGLLSAVPEAGGILSALTYIFWPSSGDNVWDQVKQQVEQLLSEQLADATYKQVADTLEGLNISMSDYLDAVKTGDTTNISTQWIATKTAFDVGMPDFQEAGYELLLLPFFAQWSNLYLSLLRDGMLFGSSWGWNEAYQKLVNDYMIEAITNCSIYTGKIYDQGYQNVVNNTPTDYHNCQPFRSVNAYVRQMTLMVNDFKVRWMLFDPVLYSNITPMDVYLSREIYSDPVGSCDDSGAINIPSAPTQFPTSMTIWTDTYHINAAQLTYPTDCGPDNETQTPIVGVSNANSNSNYKSNRYTDMSITDVLVWAGNVPEGIEFLTQGSSSYSKPITIVASTTQLFHFAYTYQLLSSVYINGISKYYNCADSMIFGFMYIQPSDSNSSTTDWMRIHYISAPLIPSEDLLIRHKLAAVADSEDWAGQREVYQTYAAKKANKR